MPIPFDIRPVHSDDAKDLLEIYAPIVLNTATSFETEVPSTLTFKERIKLYSKKSPWLVATNGDKVIGYAYATDHRSRQAYQWSQEVTVYIHQDYRKQGIAEALYLKLLNLMKALGFRKAIAVITLPNEASILLHKKLGFNPIGEMTNIGYKLEKWHSTSWWDMDLQPDTSPPNKIGPMDIDSQA